MPTARFFVTSFSPDPCSSGSPVSLTVTSPDLPSITSLTAMSGSVNGELDVNLGWFMTPNFSGLVTLLNGGDGCVIDLDYKLKNGKKTVTAVDFSGGDDAALARIAGSMNRLEATLIEEVSKPMLEQLSELNQTTRQILKLMLDREARRNADGHPHEPARHIASS